MTTRSHSGKNSRLVFVAALFFATSAVVSAQVTPGTSSGPAGTSASGSWIDDYRAPAKRLVELSTSSDFAWKRLAELTDTFGPRLSGSPNLEMAIEWAVNTLRADGMDVVRTDPVRVPRWVRGHESLEILEPGPRSLPLLALGGSVPTPGDGIEAEPLVVNGFEELERRAAEVKGRVVVFNAPFTGYGETVRYRTVGPSRAARLGAVALLVRSVGPVGLRTPHTGALQYEEGLPQIPAAAIAAEDAAMFARMQQRGTKVRLRLKLESSVLPDAMSANVIAELRGRERPEEIVVVSGHFDSWDVGTGASDDGAGCLMAWEAIRLVKEAGLRPRRTLRLVMFTNEENGLRGGLNYLERYRHELANHVLMFEADMGTFAPLSLGFSGPAAARARLDAIGSLLRTLGIERIGPAGGGADIGPSAEAGGIPTLSLAGDPRRYFTVHHAPADTVDRIEPSELARASAATAVMAYVIADMPERLGDTGVRSTK